MRSDLLGAWKGIWLFTWRPRLSWARAPRLVGGLVVLPLLVLLTTSPGIWARRGFALGSPVVQFQNFYNRLLRNNAPLEEAQRNQLREIFIQEYARAEAEAAPVPGRPAIKLPEMMEICYERIGRAATFLTEDQRSHLTQFARR